ncbi:hypothetical protein BJ322DRAFT_1045036 [Thelephora terrestris]|uniref:FAD/NAD(P)-binding domain-containing protein n=1 Tax=Thelephora terrestris TaxID=56493 RepID=A0A9P6HII1_9AGAM|nr:hypothetical protein BJ322DRAFT_1045036 [Thelephora terrestris]
MHQPTKTVVVLGASYGGHRAVHQLVERLPEDWRVVVIERNTHFTHLYALPRLAILRGHEHKPFIPYTKLFKPKACPGRAPATDLPESVKGHDFIHANVTSVEAHRINFTRLSTRPCDLDAPSYVDFDYLVYALGSHLPAPINIWSPSRSVGPGTPNGSQDSLLLDEHDGTKTKSRQWLRTAHSRIKAATSILVVGGGALGVQFATDIADVYPNKAVTLVHSRDQLLPGFDKWMHDTITNRLREMNVRLLLNTRIDLSSFEIPASSPYACGTPTSEGTCTPDLSPTLSSSDLSESPCPTPPPASPHLLSPTLPPPVAQTEDSRVTISTTDGREIHADLILFCTGQTHNTSFLKMLSPESINHKSGSAAYVTPSLQLGVKADNGEVRLSGYPHIFVVGDAADAFGARKSGNSAWYQAEHAVRNVVRLIEGRDSELESYTPPPAAIKVSLGLKYAINQTSAKTFQMKEDCCETLNVNNMWSRRGLSSDDQTV